MPSFTPETRANLQKVRDHIAKLEERRFRMSGWGNSDELRATQEQHSCHTAGCIGGWAEALLFQHGIDPEWSAVGEAIGLSRAETDELFFCVGSLNTSLDEITQTDALVHLDHILAGGAVSWDAAMELPRPEKAGA